MCNCFSMFATGLSMHAKMCDHDEQKNVSDDWVNRRKDTINAESRERQSEK